MSKTYGNNSKFPGVKVSLRGGDTAPMPPTLDEEEYQLVTICIWMTIDINGGGWAIDEDSAATALECYGYSPYESRPMVWATLEEIGKRIEPPKDL